MATRFGDLVRKVGSLKPLAIDGLLPGALVCGLVVSGLTMANASPLTEAAGEASVHRTLGSASLPGQRSYGEMQESIDLTAMDYYGGALAAMAKADLSRMSPESAMKTLANMARSTLSNAPSRGDLVQGPSGVAGLEAALAFFSRVESDSTPQSVQARALEIANLAGVDVSTFRFEGILAELRKANEYKTATLNQIAEVVYDQRGTTVSDIVEKAVEGQFERHATQAALLDQLAWAAMTDEGIPEEERDLVIAEINSKVVMDGAFGAIVATWERDGTWTAREGLAKIVNSALAASQRFVSPTGDTPRP